MCLHRGSEGVVRRVIDKNSGNQYAAKFLRFPDQETKSELETELEMLTLLDHTGIIQVIDGYEDKKRLIIVMEMYPYQTYLHDVTSWQTSRCSFRSRSHRRLKSGRAVL